jgi:RimJ/RimL family protein N-acetyltransferase
MRHDLHIEGQAFRLRPVTADDGAAIVALRNRPELSRFINATSADPADQYAWLEGYHGRAGDYYFIVEGSDGAFEGTIALYDVDAELGIAEWGRWILRPNSLAAVESALLLYRLAFDRLGLEAVYCRTVAANEAVVSFHNSCGLESGGIQAGGFERDSIQHDLIEQRLRRENWPAVEARLAGLAAAVARRRERPAG